MMKYKALALFDIDGTLILGKLLPGEETLHGKSFSEGFKKVYGIETSVNIINTHGMTDQQIIIEVLRKKGLSEQEIKPKIKKCTKAMIKYFRENVKNHLIVPIDGVNEFLENLKKENVLMGLVTGNVEPIAESKLKRAGLNKYFKFGGFGSDGIERYKLVKIAVKRARKIRFKGKNIFLFGDTPLDILAGKKAGIKTIGIATGIYSEEDLKKASADYVFPNLKNAEEIISVILEKSL